MPPAPGAASLVEFVHASDPHWGRQTDLKFAAAPERGACFVRDLAAMRPRPRFMVMTGDLASGAQKRPGELELAELNLASIGLPTYVVPGNHDLPPGPRDRSGEALPTLEETAWFRRHGDRGLFWTAREGPLELVGFALRNRDPDGILDRLAGHLRRPAEGIRVLVGHYPAYPVRQAGALARWGPHHVEAALPRLRRLLSEHSDSVAAYLFGHIHVVSTQVIDGVLCASGGGIAVGAPGYRILTLYPDRLVSRFLPLSDPRLARFAFWGLALPGRAIDRLHRTPDLYHRGLPWERDFCFDLSSRRLFGPDGEPVPEATA